MTPTHPNSRDAGLQPRVPGPSLLKSVVTVASGTALAQLIFVASTPAITRIYSTEDFGAFASFQSVATILALVVTGRYELAIPLPARRADAERVVRLALSLAAASCTAIVLASLTLGTLAGQVREHTPALILGLAVFAIAAFSTLTQYVARQGHFRLLSVARVARATVAAFVQLVLGATLNGPAGLVVGLTAGYAVSSGILLLGWRWSSERGAQYSLTQVARTFRRFPKFSAPAAGLTALGTTALPALLAVAHGLAVAGQFGLATRVLQLPVQLLGQALGQVIYPSFARSLNSGGHIREMVLLTATALLRVSTAVFAWLFVFGDVAFTIVFGAAWGEAGRFAQILSPWLFGSFLSAPLSQIALVFERNRTTLVIAALETTARLAVVAVGAYLGTATFTVFGLSLSGLVITSFHIRWTLGLGGVTLIELVRLNLLFVASVVLLAIASHALRFTAVDEGLVAAISLPLFGLVGLAGAYGPGRRAREGQP